MNDNKDIVIGLGVEHDGHVVIQTDEKMLPVEVVQQMLDQVITKIINCNVEEATKNKFFNIRKELAIWKFIAIAATAALILVALKCGGIL